MAHEEHHHHDAVTFRGTDVNDETLDLLSKLHPALAEILARTRRYQELDEEQKKELPALQKKVDEHDAWVPGYHAEGDRCATCGEETDAIFADEYESGQLPHAAFIATLPVHAREECLNGFHQKHPRLAPRDLDKARRSLMRDLQRPTPSMAMFFRHDVLAHPPFELEDWANSVAEANQGALDKAMMRDMERLLHWVHHRLFHH